VITRGDIASVKRQAVANKWHYRTKNTEPTPHVIGSEAMVHYALLSTIEAYMRRHAPWDQVSILSGFRSYAKQMSLWLAYKAGWGNPANYPGSSKHEASGGHATARAVDAYVGGVAFWTWVDSHNARKLAEAMHLREPYPHEPWHVELANL
jgi:hypothetical protein